MESSNRPIKSKLHDDKFYRPLVQSFVDDLPTVLEKLKEQLRKAHYDDAKDFCHQMVGAAATYGYPELAGTFEKLEVALSDDQVNEEIFSAYLEKLRNIFMSIHVALDQGADDEY